MTGPRKTDPYRNSRLMATPAMKTPSSLSCGPVAAKGIPSREFQLAATPRLRPSLSRNVRSPFMDDTVKDDEPCISEEAAQNALVDLVAKEVTSSPVLLKASTCYLIKSSQEHGCVTMKREAQLAAYLRMIWGTCISSDRTLTIAERGWFQGLERQCSF